ncbi:NAD(P)/FAD-dependent oxidoreductase [Deinococcus psychrotolerans]|uniref:NAD(P)/FAD-dependent oxidoreductase n=1 Tax=Deinococcus psychrotolerans TaxID=2489213 RepID=A0A3G8YF95_9DEIO|nr:NAD(P)/FAD-dependent oxidoreductase [Deinococcus psychrotolerans]AZI42847.1 NAD(P)/FAD-dependent oxidoreductase [Deinococcus psychrotolerans]
MTRSRPPSTIVLGAGFAGLAAALRLARAGASVTVLDRLERPGGKAALGWTDFSSGPSVVTMPDIFRGLYQRLEWAQPLLTPARPTTTYHYAGKLSGRTFAPEALNVAGSLDSTLAQLSRSEASQYRRLLDVSRQMYQDAAPTFLFGPPPSRVQLARYALTKGRRAAPLKSLAQLVQSGPLLTPFWLRFATYLGANPYKAPAVLHNIAWVELGLGVWHLGEGPSGGLGALAARLGEEAEQLGVRFEYGVTVKHLLRSGRQIIGAHTDQGAYSAEQWVSAADHATTTRWLGLPPEKAPRGISGFALQLRLERDVGRAHHLFFPAEYRQEWRDIALGKLPSDPALYLHLDGQRAFLLINAPPNPNIVADPYTYGAALLDNLQARYAEKYGAALPVSSWLPLDPALYALTGMGGAIYGAAPHGLLGSLRPGWTHTAARNLVQVGGTVHPGGGVPLSLLSGWNGAGQVLGLPYDDLGGQVSGA